MHLDSSWRLGQMEFQVSVDVKHEQVTGAVARSASSFRSDTNKAKFGKLALIHKGIDTANWNIEEDIMLSGGERER